MVFSRTAATERQKEIYLEPLPFLAAGLLCLSFDTMLGTLLCVCAILYSLSFSAAYWMGDNMVMDLIDEYITAEQTEQILVNGLSPGEAKGVNLRFRKPSEREQQEQLADQLAYEEHAAAVF